MKSPYGVVVVGMGIERSVNKFFRRLDEAIESKLDGEEGNLLPSLNVLRHKALDSLRANTGNADGWSWIAEYMILHVVRRTIERTMGFEFEIRDLQERPYVFIDPDKQFSLGASIPLYQLLNDSSDEFLKRKPDICLLYRERFILSLEVKTTIPNDDALKRSLTTLTGIQERGWQKPQSRAFFVTFGRTLEVAPEKIVKEYREFYEAKGRYVGRFNHTLQDSDLFKEIYKGSRMKLLSLEECLGKIETLLKKLPST